jgi:hypothetical protein
MLDGSCASGLAKEGFLPQKTTPCDPPNVTDGLNPLNLSEQMDLGEWRPINEWLALKKLKMIQLIESFRRNEHYESEDDFYSCPCHPRYFGNEDRDYCNCGLIEDNLKVDQLLKLLEGLK